MKNFFKMMPAVIVLALFSLNLQAQTKKTVKRKTTHSTHTVVPHFTERNFGSPTSVTQITDVTEASPGYESLKDLIETDGITMTYDDNTFKGAEILRRGDFIVSFNSALNALKKSMDANNVDTGGLLNTYDKNRSNITRVSEIKDLKPESVYYPSVLSLVERWGIAAPFTKAKLLNAGGIMTESEVYDIIRVIFNYTSTGTNPYSKGITRQKFAVVLDNAVAQEMSKINQIHSTQVNAMDDQRRHINDSLQMVDKARRDATAKEIELRRIEAQRQEAEAKKKLLNKHHK